MVVKGLSMSKLSVYVGLTCLACGSFVMTVPAVIAQEQEEKLPVPTAKAESKPEPDEEKGDLNAVPAAAKEELPEVTFPQTRAEDTADAASLEPIQKAILEFAQTFNKHDVKAVSELFTAQGEITNQVGKVTRGRDAIRETFEKLFSAHGDVRIRFEVQSMRFVSPELAIEEGVSIMSHATDNEVAPHRDRYTVTHAKVDGKWLIATARDWAEEPLTGTEQLQQLDWLVGEWVDENGETLVHTAYHWSADKHYLLSEYSVQAQDRPASQGTQRIGWDPRYQKLHSWTFDTAGGFTEGLWSRSGDQWVVKITGVAADGRARSATNILTRLSKDHATYQSRDRVVGGDVMPDLHEVPIVRKPPKPTPRERKAESK